MRQPTHLVRAHLAGEWGVGVSAPRGVVDPLQTPADDEELEAEGHVDQVKGNLKLTGEKIKDVFKN